MNTHRQVAMVVFTIVFFLSFWSIDLSVTAMINPGMMLTNGLVARHPVQVYHFSLYAAIMSFFLMTILVIDSSMKNPLIKPFKVNR